MSERLQLEELAAHLSPEDLAGGTLAVAPVPIAHDRHTVPWHEAGMAERMCKMSRLAELSIRQDLTAPASTNADFSGCCSARTPGYIVLSHVG